MRLPFFLLISCLALPWSLIPARATTYIVFRYDDLAADQPGERATNPQRRAIWEAEQAADRMFEKAGMPYVSAIIPEANPAYLLASAAKQPYPLSADPEKVAFVKQSMNAGRMQVAMHGFNHTDHRPAKARSSEFTRPFDEQYRDLVAGRKILTETLGCDKITTFVPPFNGWDEHTAGALVKAGFEILSADRYQPGDTTTPITYIPFTAQLWDLEAMLAQNMLPDDSIVVVLFHPPQIAKLPGQEDRFFGVERFAELLAKLSAKPGIKIVNFDQLRSVYSDLTSARYCASARLTKLQSLWAGILPVSCLPGIKNHNRYLTENEYTKTYNLWCGLSLVAGIALAGVGCFLSFLICQKLPNSLRIVLMSGTFIALAVGIWLIIELARRGFYPNSIRTFPVIFLFGLFAGAICYMLKRRPTTATTSL